MRRLQFQNTFQQADITFHKHISSRSRHSFCSCATPSTMIDIYVPLVYFAPARTVARDTSGEDGDGRGSGRSLESTEVENPLGYMPELGVHRPRCGNGCATSRSNHRRHREWGCGSDVAFAMFKKIVTGSRMDPQIMNQFLKNKRFIATVLNYNHLEGHLMFFGCFCSSTQQWTQGHGNTDHQ